MRVRAGQAERLLPPAVRLGYIRRALLTRLFVKQRAKPSGRYLRTTKNDAQICYIRVLFMTAVTAILTC